MSKGGGTAKHPQGVRRIRKAAKLPTAAQPVTEGFRLPVPKPSPCKGEGGPKGRMRVGPDGAVVIEGADTEVRPYKSYGNPQ